LLFLWMEMIAFSCSCDIQWVWLLWSSKMLAFSCVNPLACVNFLLYGMGLYSQILWLVLIFCFMNGNDCFFFQNFVVANPKKMWMGLYSQIPSDFWCQLLVHLCLYILTGMFTHIWKIVPTRYIHLCIFLDFSKWCKWSTWWFNPSNGLNGSMWWQCVHVMHLFC
jgi:hypothetical protein